MRTWRISFFPIPLCLSLSFGFFACQTKLFRLILQACLNGFWAFSDEHHVTGAVMLEMMSTQFAKL